MAIFVAIMFLAMSLFVSSLVLGVQSFLHQPQRFLFVEVGGAAEIPCSSREDLQRGEYVQWYLRRAGEAPMCMKVCAVDTNGSKFACKHQMYSTTLEIRDIQRQECGVYYCAYNLGSSLIFGNGTTVIVGDSFTDSSSALLLGPVAGENRAREPPHLACVIRGVFNLVQVSWRIPTEEPAQGLWRTLEASDGSLTLIHHISIPWANWASGVTVTCQVAFNSSGSSVTKHAMYSASACSGCRQEAVRYVVVGAVDGARGIPGAIQLGTGAVVLGAAGLRPADFLSSRMLPGAESSPGCGAV
ncbi:immunoglobulin alpha-2 heavy chain-like [Alligator sinensis]|uniref:immunoglobulin alpha-2 heavy chain-like n=1 Tax=Alligator sinensis TaxID=38654 RepID=UPI000D71DD78|nr:immunoglobulin alpha-2 heavy chain-like [Alligator sinensis]